MGLPNTGQLSLADIQTEFGGTAPTAISEYYGAASGVPASGQISISDFYGTSSFTMPSGIIIPFTGVSIPSGWTQFTAANTRGIIGAGSTYAAGATGGNSLSTNALSLNSAGTHSQASFGGSGGGDPNQPTGAGGAHGHTVTLTVNNPHPLYKSYKLIKASADTGSVPQNGVVLGVGTSPTGPSNIDSGIDRFLYGDTNVANGGSSSYTMSGTTSNAGSHLHPNLIGDGGSGQNKTRYSTTSGGHTHTANGTVSVNPAFIYAAAFSNTSADFTFSGPAIAMYESATPPTGWAICDGTSGTPDMRDKFVKIGTTANQGTTGGNNTHAVNSISAGGYVGDHQHDGPRPDQPGSTNNAQHNTYSWNHTHNAANTNVSGPTPYYGLYFIMFTG